MITTVTWSKQDKIIKNNDTLKGHKLILTGSTVAVHRKESGPWMHGTIADHGNNTHNGISYKIRIRKTGTTVTRIARHVKTTPISSEQYLRDTCQNDNTYICRDDLYRH